MSLVACDFVNAGLRPPPPAAATLTKPRSTSPVRCRPFDAAQWLSPIPSVPPSAADPESKPTPMQGPQRWLESNAALTPTSSLGARARRNEPGAGRYADPILAPPDPGQPKAEYMTVQATFDLASRERPIHDGRAGLRPLSAARVRPAPIDRSRWTASMRHGWSKSDIHDRLHVTSLECRYGLDIGT